MSERANAVRVQGVSFAYDDAGPRAVDGLTLEIPEGAVTALLGPNGSGKTTLLNLILGWLSPDEGEIRIHGARRQDTTRSEWGRRVGLVAQSESSALELELREYVLLGRAPYLGLLNRPRGDDRELAAFTLARIGLDALRDRPLNALSGGERQLASIARVLVQDPRILLLDEPLSHLDLANTRRVLGLLRQSRRAGHTIVLTTHDPNVAAAIADHAVLLREGHLVASGGATEVLTSERLVETYGVRVDVHRVAGRTVVLPPLDSSEDTPSLP